MGGSHRSALGAMLWYSKACFRVRKHGARALLAVLVVLASSAAACAQPFPGLQSPEPPLVGPPPLPNAGPVAPADPPTPVVSLHVRAPASAAPGQEVDYRLLVENPSRAAAHHVVVRVPLPTNTAFVRASPEPNARDPQVAWELGTLPPGASREILLTLKPSENGDVDVIARVQFEHGETVHTRVGAAVPTAAPAPMPPAAPIPTAAPIPPAAPPPAPVAPAAPPAAAPTLRLRKTGPTQALLGDLVPFQLTVTNTGTAEAVNVELADSLPPGLEFWSKAKNELAGNIQAWKIGRLAAGETAVREYEAFAKTVGDQENVAQVTAAGGLFERASWRVHINEPKLTLAVAVPPKRLLNRPARCQISVANGGSAALTNVEVFVDLPAGVQAAGPPSDNGRKEEGRVHWILGDAPAGGRRTLTVDLTAAQDVEAVVKVRAKADRGVTAQAEAKTAFVGAAGLRVDIDKGDDPLPVGRVADYVVHVRNGGSAAARNVQLTVTAPEQMAVVGQAGPTEGTPIGPGVTFAVLPILDAGKEVAYTVHLRAQRAGEVKVVVELRSDALATPLREEETTTIFEETPAAPPAAPPAPPGPG